MSDVLDILYVRFALPDLARQKQFLDDFGMQTFEENDVLYGRGTEPTPFLYAAEPLPAGETEPRWLGIGFEARSQEGLERIAAIDGVPVEQNDRPGGGLIARLTDPNGRSFEVVHGFDRPDALAVPARLPMNFGADRPRVNERVEIDADRPIVRRLGHCVFEVEDFRASEAWYKERLGVLTSDEICLDPSKAEETVIGAFMRADRGADPTDHHMIFPIGAGKSDFQHAAFEVSDWDTLMASHYSLDRAGYTHAWGVGKHILGSQVFDYWKDPHGLTLEHFTDGDLFDNSVPPETRTVQELMGALWGPDGSPA